MKFRTNVGYLADLCSRVGVLCALGLAVLVAVAAPASAQTCTFGITDLSFGGIDLTANTVSDTTATLTANCQGQSGKVVRVCPSFGAGSGGSNAATGDPRYMLNGASKLGYNMFADAARTQIWASFRTGPVWGTPTIDIHLTAGGIGSVTQTVYGRIYANLNSRFRLVPICRPLPAPTRGLPTAIPRLEHAPPSAPGAPVPVRLLSSRP